LSIRHLTVISVLPVLSGCTGLSFPPAPDGSGTGDLPTGMVRIGDDTFQVEIADTPAARTRGLMERYSLAEDAGMLFIFDEPRVLSFWMLNTPIPLDIDFIREDLTISSTDTMAPFSLTSHASIEPVPFALEVGAGEFERRGIEPGDTVVFEGVDQSIAP